MHFHQELHRLTATMRFHYFIIFFFAFAWSVSIKRELGEELVARDSKLKAAKDILTSVTKIAGGKLKSGGSSSKNDDMSDSEQSDSNEVSQPIPDNTPAPAPAPAPAPGAGLGDKLKTFVIGQLKGLLAKITNLLKSKVLQKVDKIKSKVAPPPSAAPAKRDLEESLAELMQALEATTTFTTDSDSDVLLRRTLVEDVMTQVFVALKRSGLIDYVIRMSLTDEEVRAGVADITVELIRADVIPYSEVFTALQESGLALDVVKFSLTDAQTRLGLIDLVLELVPQLIEICTPTVVSKANFSSLLVTSTTTLTA